MILFIYLYPGACACCGYRLCDKKKDRKIKKKIADSWVKQVKTPAYPPGARTTQTQQKKDGKIATKGQ